jgi:hypothetical protein
MNSGVKDNILKILIDRAPNYVNEKALRRHLAEHDESDFREVMKQLQDEGQIKSFLDKREEIQRPVHYYKIASVKNLPIRESVKVGDVDVPRTLGCSSPKVIPSNHDEVVEQLAQHANSLEMRFTKLVKEEREAHWARTISAFTIFLGILAIVFKITTKPAFVATVDALPDYRHLLMVQFIDVVPLAFVFIVFGFFLRWIIKN